MSQDIPRGTAVPLWPALLAEHEAEQSGMEHYAQERRRVLAAGYAHIDRLAVDGGPVTEPKRTRRRLALNTVGLIGIAICALGVVALFGVVG